jgi:purine-nucleoside/S-methyl-5'-thioadenosine phosphorylase / adenosine deaminase
MMFDTLPQPSGSFAWVQAAPGPALVCRALEPFARHLFTTRSWALGASFDSGEEPWIEIAGAMDAKITRVRQVHGAAVLIRHADAPAGAAIDGAQRPTADIIVSNNPREALAIQTADCVPLLIADRRTGAVAAAHAGWRGLAAGVPRVAVEALVREFGSRPRDLIAAAGPSIGACCYEVGADVREQFARAPFVGPVLDRWFSAAAQPTARNPSMAGVRRAARSGHWYFDSGSAARAQLVAAGVPAEQVFAADLCTASHPRALCSYRRDGPGAGRLAAAIRPRSGSRPSEI